MKPSKKPLIIFVGNSLFKDDKVSLIIGEKLKEELIEKGFDVEITERSGFIFVDLLSERESVVIVDSFKTGKFKIGEVVLIDKIDYDAYTPFTPHYVGLPEALKLLEELSLGSPRNICVIGIEVKDPFTISESMSEEIEKRLEEIVEKVRSYIYKCVEN